MTIFPQSFIRKWCALSRLHKLWKNEGGAAAVVMAVLAPVLIGGMGLGAETGYWYYTQRKLQHAADVAAHAAGVRKRAGDSSTNLQATALNVATNSGFLSKVGNLALNIPPKSGSMIGRSDSVEVILLETHPRLLSSVFSKEPVNIASRAVAQIVGGSTACILALSKTASGAATISGSTAVTLDGCSVASNSNATDALLMSGNGGSLRTDCAFSAGGAVVGNLTLTVCSSVSVNAPPAIDPYASVAQPVDFGPCDKNNKVGTPTGSKSVQPDYQNPVGVRSKCFLGGLDLKGTVTFDPGLYIINGGDFTVNGGDANSNTGASIIGQGVTFFLTNGATLKLTGNVTLSLSAPTSGPFSGILFFGDRNATGVTHNISGTSGSTLQGAIYAAASVVNYRGNSSTTNGCTQIIANQVVFTGNSTLRSSCAAAGTKDMLAGQIVKLVE